MTLRIIHNVWRYEKQTKNAQEFARRAGALYDKLRVVMEDMAQLGSLLRTADECYQTAMLKLASGNGRARTVNFEVRHKRTYIKRDVLEEQARKQQEALDAARRADEEARTAVERSVREEQEKRSVEQPFHRVTLLNVEAESDLTIRQHHWACADDAAGAVPNVRNE